MNQPEKWPDIELTGCSPPPRYIRPIVTAAGDGSPATIRIEAFREAPLTLHSFETRYTRRRRAFRVFLRVVGAAAIAAGIVALCL